jgi:hypothetical protein
LDSINSKAIKKPSSNIDGWRGCIRNHAYRRRKIALLQLPALLQDGVAIIIPPLIALMKNQVDLVRNYSSNDNLAHFLNSSLNKRQITVRGYYQWQYQTFICSP